MTKATLAHVALVVREYDEAIAFYVGKLGFRLVADEPQPEQDKRWVLIEPPGGGTSILLARAKNERERAFIGNQAGGRVFMFLSTDDFERDYAAFQERGVEFTRTRQVHSYGTVAVFKDLYGTLWDLVEFA